MLKDCNPGPIVWTLSNLMSKFHVPYKNGDHPVPPTPALCCSWWKCIRTCLAQHWFGGEEGWRQIMRRKNNDLVAVANNGIASQIYAWWPYNFWPGLLILSLNLWLVTHLIVREFLHLRSTKLSPTLLIHRGELQNRTAPTSQLWRVTSELWGTSYLMAAGLRWFGKYLQFPQGIFEGHGLQTVCYLVHLSWKSQMWRDVTWRDVT